MNRNADELKGFRSLYEFSRSLLAGDDSEELFSHLVEAAQIITDADETLLFNTAGHPEPVIRAMAFSDGEERSGKAPNYSRTLVDEVIKRGEPLLLEDVHNDPRFEKAPSVQFLSITSAIGVPFRNNGKLTGVLYAARRRVAENFDAVHRDLLTIAASQASLLMAKLDSIEALRESEARHRSLVEMSPSTIAVVQDKKIVFASNACVELWGLDSIDDVLGRDVGSLFDPWRSQALLESLRIGEAFEAVDAWVTPDQEDSAGVPVEVVGRPIQFDGAPALQLMVSEVGEKTALLAQRVRTDRLVVMGTMASTVGHEINNPLSYVYANIDFAVEELEYWWDQIPAGQPDAQTRQDVMEGLRSALEGTERIRAVVESIQNFSRLDEGDDEPTLVEQPLQSSLRIAKTTFHPEVQLQVDIQPTAPVPLSAARMGQVFLNLLTNAAQALDEMESDPDDPKKVEVRTRQVDEKVIIEVADNGPGISPSVRQHIFEPFVSTKSDEEGTGLGLAICQDIVQDGGGEIEVDSEPGQGCVFRVCLPASSEPQTQSIQMYGEAEGEQTGRILVIDPDLAVAQSLKRVLQSRHDVTAVNTHGEAVELLSSKREFDIVLCDLRLRGGLGRDLFTWIEDHSPKYWQRLVAMTASQLTPKTRQFLDGLPNPWISKPFDINQVRAIIARLLEKVDHVDRVEEVATD